MGVRRRGYDIAAYVRTYAADKAARDEALRVVELWKTDLARRARYLVVADDPGHSRGGQKSGSFPNAGRTGSILGRQATCLRRWRGLLALINCDHRAHRFKLPE